MMDYSLLWLVAVVTSLLFTALAAALFSSFKKALWRHVWMLVVIGGLTCLFGIASLFTGLMYYNNLIIPSWLFPYTTSFALVYVITAVGIWRKGLAAKAGTPAARAWRRGILTSCLVLGIILTMTAYTLIDVKRQIAFTNVNTDLKTRLQEIWPSKPPPQLNAYPIYEQASNAITDQDKDRIRDYTKPDRQPTKPEIMELIERNRNVIDMLHTASQRPYCFWGRPVDTSILFLWEFPRFIEYRSLSGLLGLKAKGEALSGNPAGAFKELAVIRSMAKHLRDSPDLLSWAISWAVTKQEFDVTEYILARTHSAHKFFTFPMTTAPSVLQSFKGIMTHESAFEFQLPFLMMQKGEVIEKLIRTYNELYESTGSAPSIVLPYVLHPLSRSLWRVFIGRSYVDNVRDKWGKINRITESGYQHWRDFSFVKAELEGRKKSLMYSFLNLTIGYDDDLWIFLYIHCPIGIDVHHRLIDLALAASAYREKEGSYPATVDDLVPTFLETAFIDPYDGKPLKIKKVPGGLDIYSTGPADPKDLVNASRWGGPFHFYLGREAYEKYRVEPAKLKRAQEAEERKEREKKQMEWDKERKRKPDTILKKKKKQKRK